jgi:hypothetical protein
MEQKSEGRWLDEGCPYCKGKAQAFDMELDMTLLNGEKKSVPVELRVCHKCDESIIIVKNPALLDGAEE